jgi:hypothetical protein
VRLAHADVPPADGGTTDPSCTVAAQSIAGSTCGECVISGSDTSCQLELGADFNFVCDQSATVQVWCNGPARTATQNPSCAVPAHVASGASGAAGGVGAILAVVGIAVASLRRRRRT